MLILVRHGRTAANAAGLLQGRLDVPLDEVGQQQARLVGEALRTRFGESIRVVSSPLTRALQTAAGVADHVEVDERFQEIAYGVYEGKPLGSVGAAQWARWRSDPEFSLEGAESLNGLLRRVVPALEDLAEAAQREHIVVVSHVSPIKAAMAWSLGVGIDISWRCQLDHASMTTVAVSERGPSLTLFNDTSHLR